MRELIRPQWIVLLLALVGSLVAAPASAAPPYSVTLVNNTGGPVWVGSAVNAEGSQELDGLPMLKAGESSTVRIPLGKPMLCVNPNRDEKTPYSNAIGRACPKAYSWSKHDSEPGNRVMYSCRDCNKLTVTFH